MISLRGHHLICLQFFRGQGYDAGFLEKLAEVRRRALFEKVEVVDGPDEVCRACPYLKEEQCTLPESSEAEIREMDRKALDILGLSLGSRLTWPEETQAALQAGFARWARHFCEACSWRPVCEPAANFQTLLGRSRKGER